MLPWGLSNMARIYQTRTLLDPSHLQILNQRQAQKYNEDAQRRAQVLNAFNNMTSQLGQAATGAYDRYKTQQGIDSRKQLLGDYEQNDDPMYRAAADEFVRSGNPNSMISYQMQRDAAAARQADLQQRKADAARATELHNRVLYQDLNGQYGSLLNQYYDAPTEAERMVIGDKLKTLEAKANEIGYNLGNEAQRNAVLEARQADAADKRTAELAEEAQKKYSFDHRMNIENNVLPNAKSLEDKTNYKKMIKSMYDNGKLTKEDFDALYNKIESTTTQKEQIKKANEGAVASASGEQVKKNIQQNQAEQMRTNAKTAVSGMAFDKATEADRQIEQLQQQYPGVEFRSVKRNGKRYIEVVGG